VSGDLVDGEVWGRGAQDMKSQTACEVAAALTLGNGIIHWMLWSNGYRGIRVVGPAFLLNTVIAVALALLIVVRPSVVVGLAALVFSLGTLSAFLLSETVGLFGFRAMWDGQGALAATVCRWFDLHLLDRSGFRPELGHCVQCSEPPAEVTNGWVVDAGGLVCARCAPRSAIGMQSLSVRALKSLRYLLVSDFENAALLRVDEPLAAELERHLRSFLQNVIDREIHASRLIDELARMPRQTVAIP